MVGNSADSRHFTRGLLVLTIAKDLPVLQKTPKWESNVSVIPDSARIAAASTAFTAGLSVDGAGAIAAKAFSADLLVSLAEEVGPAVLHMGVFSPGFEGTIENTTNKPNSTFHVRP